MEQTFPAGTIQKIVLSNIEGDLRVQNGGSQEIRVKSGGRISTFQPEGTTLTINGCDDDIEIWATNETAVMARDIDGDAQISGINSALLGDVSGDVTVRNLGGGDVNIQDVEGDVTIESVGGPVTLGDVQ